MASPAVQHVFSTTAASYDRDRARLIPGFYDLYGWAVHLIPATASSILDLGAGTGLLSAFIRQERPYATLHLVDLSAAMLDQARIRFAADSLVTFELADYATHLPSGRWDAVVSALSIHHLPDIAKRELFARIFTLLPPGGVFMNAEQILGPTPALEARYKQLWLQQVTTLGATPQQLEDSLFRQQQDRCAPVETQLQWLREIGFTEVDCWYKNNRFATFAAQKPLKLQAKSDPILTPGHEDGAS